MVALKMHQNKQSEVSAYILVREIMLLSTHWDAKLRLHQHPERLFPFLQIHFVAITLL